MRGDGNPLKRVKAGMAFHRIARDEFEFIGLNDVERADKVMKRMKALDVALDRFADENVTGIGAAFDVLDNAEVFAVTSLEKQCVRGPDPHDYEQHQGKAGAEENA